MCNAHPCFCEPCIQALRRRLGAAGRQADVCTGDGAGTRCCSRVKKGLQPPQAHLARDLEWLRCTTAWRCGRYCRDTSMQVCVGLSPGCRAGWVSLGAHPRDVCASTGGRVTAVLSSRCSLQVLQVIQCTSDHLISISRGPPYSRRKKNKSLPKCIMARIQPLSPCIAVASLYSLEVPAQHLYSHVFPHGWRHLFHMLFPTLISQGTGMWLQSQWPKQDIQAGFVLFVPLCRAPTQVLLLLHPPSFRKYLWASCLWDRHSCLGLRLAKESKSYQRWAGGWQQCGCEMVGKGSLQIEKNQKILFLENCATVLIR